jgi:hypothetical protein
VYVRAVTLPVLKKLQLFLNFSFNSVCGVALRPCPCGCGCYWRARAGRTARRLVVLQASSV